MTPSSGPVSAIVPLFTPVSGCVMYATPHMGRAGTAASARESPPAIVVTRPLSPASVRSTRTALP
eukprot:1791725-Rhodomonas_salina.1